MLKIHMYFYIYCTLTTLSSAKFNAFIFPSITSGFLANLCLNEPSISFEFVRDTARLVKEAGMKTVLVTNGCVSLEVLREFLPWIDAMNVDLKGFTEDYYKWTGGDLSMVKAFIEESVKKGFHVEVTELILPGHNDSEEET